MGICALIVFLAFIWIAKSRSEYSTSINPNGEYVGDLRGSLLEIKFPQEPNSVEQLTVIKGYHALRMRFSLSESRQGIDGQTVVIPPQSIDNLRESWCSNPPSTHRPLHPEEVYTVTIGCNSRHNPVLYFAHSELPLELTRLIEIVPTIDPSVSK